MSVPTSSSDVQYFEEYEQNVYRGKFKPLGEALRSYIDGECRRVVIFANQSAFDLNPAFPEISTFFPQSFWCIVREDLNGAFGLERSENTSKFSYDTWSTFKMKHVFQDSGRNTIEYNWSQVSVFTRQSANKQFVLFIDCPPAVNEQLVRNCFSGSYTPVGLASFVGTAIEDPFIWHALLIGALEVEYEKDYWNLRDIVRSWEKKRHQEPDFTLLHDLARHLIHAKEIFEVAKDTTNSIIHHHQSLQQEFGTEEWAQKLEPQIPPKLFKIIQEKLYISDRDMAAKQARATSLNERLHNEINLAYHVVTQKSNQLSIDLAQLARRDNATMKALALIGVLYLPGTFISGIFGMTFFNYQPPNNSNSADWVMSDKFWIYWVITIPVTIFTVLIWAMLDETAEMYETMIGKTKLALQQWWKKVSSSQRRKPLAEDYQKDDLTAKSQKRLSIPV